MSFATALQILQEAKNQGVEIRIIHAKTKTVETKTTSIQFVRYVQQLGWRVKGRK